MKKKILHILNTSTYSGAENVVCTIIKNMSTEYEMIYCSPNGKIAEKLKKEGINYYPIEKLSYKNLKKVINELKPDIIHAHDNTATVLASLFSNKYKIISHIHGNNKIMNTMNLKTLVFNICSRRINKIIWVSDSSYDGYYFKKNVASKSIILYNVINQQEIIKKSNEYLLDKQYDLIFLGRLGYPKNPERLIRIVREIKVKKDKIRVAIVGDGPERKRIEELIDKYNLKNNIELYGFQGNPYPILKNSKVLIMTSIYEGTPMCALEAQALGKPIIATPVDGLKKIVKNNYNGYLSDDDDELVEKIILLTSEEDMYMKYSKYCLEIFKECNNLNNYCRTISEIYEGKK